MLLGLEWGWCGGREGGSWDVGMLAVFGRWAGEGERGRVVVVYLNCLCFFGWSGWLVGWGDGRGGFVALLRAKGKGGGFD